MRNMPKGMMTLKQACEVWQISRWTYYTWLKKGVPLPKPWQPFGEGGVMAFREEDVQAFLKSDWMND